MWILCGSQRSYIVAWCLTVIFRLWTEVNMSRRTEQGKVEKESEGRVRINKGNEMKIKIWGVTKVN